MVGGDAQVATNVVGPLVDDEVYLRNNPTVRVGARDNTRVARGIIEQAVVGQVCVTGDKNVDCRIECVVDGNDWARDAGACVDNAGGRSL